MNDLKPSFRQRSGRALARLAAAALVCWTLSTARAAVDVFLMFTDRDGNPVKGESTDKAFPGSQGWFQIYSYNLGIANPITISSATSGAGAGKATFQDFTIMKPVDTVSPTLFKYLATGDHFKTGKLVIRKAGGGTAAPPQPYLTFEFNLVFVANQNWSGSSGDDGPTESLTFKFGAMRMTYRPQNTDGTLGDPIIQMWNQVNNTATFDVTTP